MTLDADHIVLAGRAVRAPQISVGSYTDSAALDAGTDSMELDIDSRWRRLSD